MTKHNAGLWPKGEGRFVHRTSGAPSRIDDAPRTPGDLSALSDGGDEGGFEGYECPF